MTDDYYSEMLEVVKKVGNAAAEYWIVFFNVLFFCGIGMAFMKFVIKTWVASFCVCVLLLFFLEASGVKSARPDLG